ncbi:hypothetical protein PVAP13_9KG536100 [Panicum virgatum]|uniref:Uncharacterized protein n=1 Tax=Panicum virgatum TaxID=38727 RepID=A0A8T0P2P1_PANVG|nr:hypothetical protein PVAP13_9KG536100 [Panicum virgatum]
MDYRMDYSSTKLAPYPPMAPALRGCPGYTAVSYMLPPRAPEAGCLSLLHCTVGPPCRSLALPQQSPAISLVLPPPPRVSAAVSGRRRMLPQPAIHAAASRSHGCSSPAAVYALLAWGPPPLPSPWPAAARPPTLPRHGPRAPAQPAAKEARRAQTRGKDGRGLAEPPGATFLWLLLHGIAPETSIPGASPPEPCPFRGPSSAEALPRRAVSPIAIIKSSADPKFRPPNPCCQCPPFPSLRAFPRASVTSPAQSIIPPQLEPTVACKLNLEASDYLSAPCPFAKGYSV